MVVVRNTGKKRRDLSRDADEEMIYSRCSCLILGQSCCVHGEN